VFKDPRQLDYYNCCQEASDDNLSYLTQLIKERLTAEKIKYYKTLSAPLKPNTQEYNTGV
jgi:hypothetical protein